MCIRDSIPSPPTPPSKRLLRVPEALVGMGSGRAAAPPGEERRSCLLYTSDAADDMQGVDLG
eukprot:13139674-Alexandrium_andersonii.AAC.1